MKINWKNLVILLSMFTLILGGCAQDMNVSAEEIIHNAIESEKKVTTYQGKADVTIYEEKELTDHILLEEYVADGKRKVITESQLNDEQVVALNDGTNMIMYDMAKQEAFEMDVTELGDYANLSPKEQFKMMMESMQDSHTHELVGEEKLLDYDTYHIKVKANDADNLLGDMEIWVEQKTWFVVKVVSEAGGLKTELEYTELDLSPELSEETFTLDIPDNVEITNLEDSFGPDKVTIEEAEEALGQAFLVFPEDEVVLTDLGMYDFSSELERYEVELNYTSKDDIPMFTLSIFPTPDDVEVETGDYTIRGNDAEYEEIIHGLIWDEDGLRYTLLITNPDVEVEDVIELAETMQLSSEK